MTGENRKIYSIDCQTVKMHNSSSCDIVLALYNLKLYSLLGIWIDRLSIIDMFIHRECI